MINLEAGPERLSGENGRFAALDGNTPLDHGETHERFPRHLLHLPRDYALAIRWLRPSFSTEMIRTPGRQVGSVISAVAALNRGRHLAQDTRCVSLGRDEGTGIRD
ncbi:hypothetical protein [Bradyrhizobium sp. USDA 4353]